MDLKSNMRLIDANSIVRSDPIPTGDVGYDQGVEDGRMHVYECIDEAATVEAIPIEWAQKEATGAREEGSHYIAGGIAWLIERWRIEQANNRVFRA